MHASSASTSGLRPPERLPYTAPATGTLGAYTTSVLTPEMWDMAITIFDELNLAAAKRLYALPGVVEVRREDVELGIVFWVVMDRCDLDAIEQLAEADLALTAAFPQVHLFVERVPAGSQSLNSSTWQRRHLLPHATTHTLRTSSASYT